MNLRAEALVLLAHASRDWPLIWSLIAAAALLTVVGLGLLFSRR